MKKNQIRFLFMEIRKFLPKALGKIEDSSHNPVRMNDEESTLILDPGENKELAINIVEEEEEYAMSNADDEENMDDMSGEGDVEKGVENEKLLEEANVVTRSEQGREHMKVEVNAVEISGNRTNERMKSGKQVKPNSKSRVCKLRKRVKRGKREKNSEAVMGINDVDTKTRNDKEYLGRRMRKKDKTVGMIFMCSSKTKQDCYHHKVFGLPSGKRNIVLKVYKGMKLFLFDFDLKLLYGIYKAAGPGGYNIEPKAFRSAFPSQVRFEVCEDCLPLPEEKFKRIIKDNYYERNKFDCQLTSEQVKNLCKLFRATSNDSGPKWLRALPKAKTHTTTDRERITKQRHINVYHDRRPRKQRRRGEPYLNVDQEWQARNQHLVQDGHHASGWNQLLLEDHDPYENASWRAPPPLQAPLPPRTGMILHPPFAYEQTMEMNGYREHPLLERLSGQFLDLHSRESRQRMHVEARGDTLHQQPDGHFLDTEFRYREPRHELHVPYRAQPLHHDLSEVDVQRCDYHTTGYALHPTTLPPEYIPRRSAYRY